MASFLTLRISFTIFTLWTLLISSAVSLTCTSQKFTNNNVYSHCLDLPSLDAFLHFSYDSSNTTLSIAFIAPLAKPDGWIAWAINPSGTGMAGSQALVAFKESDGGFTVKTYNVSSYRSIVQSKISFDVWDTSAEEENGVVKMFGKVKLPTDLAGKLKLNQVWQVGPRVKANGVLGVHEVTPVNLNAKGTLDLTGEQTVVVSNGGNSRIRLANIHGILNAVSWGFLFPLGVVIARYMRVFKSADPAWFYLHVSCQLSAYIIGVAGWGTGLKLGNGSIGIERKPHRYIGIALFCLCTVQCFALLLRPKKDHKYRLFWNFYHHGVGYSIVVLSIINVFIGLHILSPKSVWKTTYIIVISSLGGIALILEVFTWIVVIKRKSR